jgi:hypothetical protein
VDRASINIAFVEAKWKFSTANGTRTRDDGISPFTFLQIEKIPPTE